MRYKPQTPAPRYIGAVEEYDIYATPNGNLVARYGNAHTTFIRPQKGPRNLGPSNVGAWVKPLHYRHNTADAVDIAERIAAMIACFAPDLCGAHNNKGE